MRNPETARPQLHPQMLEDAEEETTQMDLSAALTYSQPGQVQQGVSMSGWMDLGLKLTSRGQ